MNYRWIIIENSLKDKNVLDKYKVLSETTFAEGTDRESRMLKVEVPEDEAPSLADLLEEKIIYPYYTHLYHEDPNKSQLIVVFSEKKFLLGKDDFSKAVEYGLANSVTEEEMQINPLDVSEETW
ncbi:MAG: hypothetical protein WD231_00390 [Candidatus Woykebacteria bacterium]